LLQREVILSLHMGKEEEPENLNDALISYLTVNPRATAKNISKALDVTKKSINSILYGQSSVFEADGNSPPRWFLVTDDKATAVESVESLSVPQSNGFVEPIYERISDVGSRSHSGEGATPFAENASEAETALAKAEELQDLGLFKEAVEQYQIASKLFLHQKNVTTKGIANSKSQDPGSLPRDSQNESRFLKALGVNVDTTRERDQSITIESMPTDRNEVEELVRQYPGISYGELTLLTDKSVDEVRDAAMSVRYLVIDDVDDDDEPEVKARREEILDGLRSAATMEFPLSAENYNDLVSRGFVKGVTAARIVQVFGSWRQGCELAGVETAKSPRSSYESKWTDRELAEAVAQFLTSDNYHGALNRYDEWRRDTGKDDDTPSMGTLRNRLGPAWKLVRRQGLDILRERWLIAQDQWLADEEVERGLE